MASQLGHSVQAATLSAAGKAFSPKAGPRSRVLFINDLSGDIDGLFAAVHAILSPSIDLRGIIGTGTGSPRETAEISVALAHEMLRLTGRAGQIPVHIGSKGKLAIAGTPDRSAGAQAIIDEARRTDTSLPLYVAVGGGLTEVASALMLDPSIASRMTLIWIGGNIASNSNTAEYNFAIDRLATRYIFNETLVPIWQVPSEVYATCIVSASEIQRFIAPCGAVGNWLYGKLIAVNEQFAGYRMNTGEVWTMGDSPLVLLTALTAAVPSTFGRQPRYERTGASAYDEVFAPKLAQDGGTEPRTEGRKIRLYTSVDTRLMFNDLYAKLQTFRPQLP
ncbi:nucleoside hydrolase [Sphingobium sp. CAP-1]|uniref:nucleoside hydrolase n=1 Tax=Sphingobium sp. CAP-1 TaxID=2676077 RepID=UPI001E4B84FA|nr:nucleoside hydrolase [Sphingobium sp. CAP-1]